MITKVFDVRTRGRTSKYEELFEQLKYAKPGDQFEIDLIEEYGNAHSQILAQCARRGILVKVSTSPKEGKVWVTLVYRAEE
jgi:hypothetical protein